MCLVLFGCCCVVVLIDSIVVIGDCDIWCVFDFVLLLECGGCGVLVICWCVVCVVELLVVVGELYVVSFCVDL